MFCVPPLEAFLFGIDTVTFPSFDLPLALHIVDPAELPTRAPFYQDLGCDLAKPVKDWIDLFSIEFVRSSGQFLTYRCFQPRSAAIE
jgi:hypothetical protein